MTHVRSFLYWFAYCIKNIRLNASFNWCKYRTMFLMLCAKKDIFIWLVIKERIISKLHVGVAKESVVIYECEDVKSRCKNKLQLNILSDIKTLLILVVSTRYHLSMWNILARSRLRKRHFNLSGKCSFNVHPSDSWGGLQFSGNDPGSGGLLLERWTGCNMSKNYIRGFFFFLLKI